ncbi:dentin sialophosphoprotein-like [Hibiscus syriacus]|uniref:Dentin sialophosphoprotein-like n=1 Tax=Hibiscus syriacus TaxID=106335 RepID=A0A6A2ZWK3_HIBSY|nr:dentin sialophosphoprotein-like [Hibiscus syriacus]
MKIYSDLKKVKQPISPGGKLASFINSLFTSGSPKNPKKKSMSEQTTSACSSASSFSRSCLSTTKANIGTRTERSVRFCPVSVILDEDSRPCGELKILHENELQRVQTSMRKPVTSKEIEYRFIEENRRVAEAARELLNSYRKQTIEEFDMRGATAVGGGDEDGEDDAASYASSDLFELDNLSAIGNERYLEELPVYETTHFDTNRAIAKGLIL